MVRFSRRDLSYETNSGPKTKTVSDPNFQLTATATATAAAATAAASQQLSHLARALDHHAQGPNIPFGANPSLRPWPRAGGSERFLNKLGCEYQISCFGHCRCGYLKTSHFKLQNRNSHWSKWHFRNKLHIGSLPRLTGWVSGKKLLEICRDRTTGFLQMLEIYVS